jgi:anaerobic magnesium-protoporphyrin IX monomethyl ester cyclase
MVQFGLISLPVMDFNAEGRLSPIGMDLVRECPPLALYWLPEVLKLQGIETVILDLVAPGRPFRECDLQQFERCAAVGISATSMSWPTALRAARMLVKHLPHKKLIFGGPHPTMFDDYVLQHFPKAYIIRGEAEQTLPILLHALTAGGSLADVPSLTFRDGDKLIRTEQAPKLSRAYLSSLPPPNYSTLPAGVYQGLSIESSRGCPFDCSFCSTNYRNSYRPLLPDRFVDNLTMLVPHVQKSKLRMIHVVDDEFTMNQPRVIQIATELDRRGQDVELSFDARANDLHNLELVQKIAPFTHEFLVGAECGYDEGLKKIGKGVTTSGLKLAAETLFKAGIAHKAHFSFIVGLPWESLSEVEKTVAFAADLAASFGVKVLIQWYTQIPGSNLWAESRDDGKVSARFYDDFGYFRNPHLFFSAVKISPDEIWKLSEIILTLKWALRAHHKHVQPIAYHVPASVMEWFPKNFKEGHRTLREAVI